MIRALLLAVLAADASAPSRSFDAATCGLLRTIAPLGGELSGGSFSRDGRRFFVGAGRTVRVYDAETWVEARRFEEHAEVVQSVAPHPDGAKVVAGGFEGTLAVWDVATGRLERTMTGHTQHVSTLSFSPDGRTLLSGAHDGTVRLWDWAAGREARRLDSGQLQIIASAWSADGRRLATAGAEGTVKVWRADTFRQERDFSPGACLALAFTLDGRRLLGANDAGVSVWDLERGEIERTLEGAAHGVGVLPDGRHVVAAGMDGSVRIWDLRQGAAAATLRHHAAAVTAVAAHPDGRTFVTVGRDRHLKVWGSVPGGMARVRPRGYCGINVQQDVPGTVLIAGVMAGMAGEAAGLRGGDVLRRVGGAELRTTTDAADQISSYQEGDEVEFEIEREGAARKVKVKLGKRPE